MKKGRHRRFEEARALKRSTDFNVDELFESLRTDAPTSERPEQRAWSEYEDDEPEDELADRYADDDDDDDDDR